MRMRWLVVAVACLSARPAEACTCGGAPQVLSPADGATDVPTNVVPVIDDVASYQQTVALTLREDGATTEVGVPFDVFTSALGTSGFVVGRPGELAPLTTYVLSLGVGGFVTSTRFTTGTARDDAPPSFAGLTGFVPEQQEYPAPALRECVNSCVLRVDGRVNRIRLQHGAGEGVIWYRLQVREAEAAAPFYEAALEVGATDLIRPFVCGTQPPVLDPDRSYCARLTAHDAAGNTAGGEVEVCTATETCTARDVDCLPVEECVPAKHGGCAIARGSGAGACRLGPAILAVLAVLRRRGRRG